MNVLFFISLLKTPISHYYLFSTNRKPIYYKILNLQRNINVQKSIKYFNYFQGSLECIIYNFKINLFIIVL